MKEEKKYDRQYVCCNGIDLDTVIDKLNQERDILRNKKWEYLVVLALENKYDGSYEIFIEGWRPLTSEEFAKKQKELEEKKDQEKKDLKVYLALREKFKDIPEGVLTGEGFDVLEGE